MMINNSPMVELEKKKNEINEEFTNIIRKIEYENTIDSKQEIDNVVMQYRRTLEEENRKMNDRIKQLLPKTKITEEIQEMKRMVAEEVDGYKQLISQIENKSFQEKSVLNDKIEFLEGKINKLEQALLKEKNIQLKGQEEFQSKITGVLIERDRFQEALDRVKQILRDVKDKEKNATKNCEEKDERIKILERQINRLELKIDEIQKERLSSEKIHLETLSRWQEQLKDKTETVDRLDKEKKHLLIQNSEVSGKLEHLTELYNELKSKYEKESKEKTVYQISLEKANQKLREKFIQTEKEAEDYKNKFNNSDKFIKESQREIDRLKKDLSQKEREFQDKLKESRLQAGEFQRDYVAEMKKVALLEVQFNEEKRILLKQTEEAKEEKENYYQLNTVLSLKLGQSEQTVNKLQEEINKLRQANSDLLNKIENLQNGNEGANNENKVLLEKVNNRDQRIEKLEKEIKEVTSEKNNLFNLSEEHKLKINTNKTTISQLKEDKLSVEKELERVKYLLSNSEKDLERSKKEIDEQKNKISQWNETISSNKKDLQEKDTLINKLNITISSLPTQEKISKLEQEVSDLSQRVKTLTSELSNSQKEGGALKIELEKRKFDIEKLNTKIENSEKSLSELKNENDKKLKELQEQKNRLESSFKQRERELLEEIESLKRKLEEKQTQAVSIKENNSFIDENELREKINRELQHEKAIQKITNENNERIETITTDYNNTLNNLRLEIISLKTKLEEIQKDALEDIKNLNSYSEKLSEQNRIEKSKRLTLEAKLKLLTNEENREVGDLDIDEKNNKKRKVVERNNNNNDN